VGLSAAGALDAFAEDVGAEGPVTVAGGRTQWEVGGPPAPGCREVRAPAGVIDLQPEEMTVRCGAGTTVADLDAALAAHGQMVALDPADPGRATVGGVLAVGRSGIRRLGYGPLRDTVLEVRYVSAEGRLVKAGGPTVKNVTGFDLCRLLVGSLGRLGLLGEVLLRTRPRPEASRWLQGDADPFDLRRRLATARSVLWDGGQVWVLLEGHSVDVEAEAAATGLDSAAGPPPVPVGARRSVRPSAVGDLPGPFLAEVGVGIVHLDHDPGPGTPPDAATTLLHHRLLATFDPTGRLNPGRRVLA
jgi:FAD/FMN-containing dehydrogenase